MISRMMMTIPDIKEQIKKGKPDEAIQALSDHIRTNKECGDEVFYLLGNAYRKKGDWQMALNNYLEAIERNPNSPAVNAKKMLTDILNFYNKDMYNQ